jgi:hypothetical protein
MKRYCYNVTADDPGDGFPLCEGEIQEALPPGVQVDDYDGCFQIQSPAPIDAASLRLHLARLNYTGVSVTDAWTGKEI